MLALFFCHFSYIFLSSIYNTEMINQKEIKKEMIFMQKLQCNGIYTWLESIYIPITESDCLHINIKNIDNGKNNLSLCNQDISNYVSEHSLNFSLYSIMSIQMMDKRCFENGYLGMLDKKAIDELEYLKDVYIL